jgi:hypothetical protein
MVPSVEIQVNAVGKMKSEVEKAYLAGFLDADGAIMACIERHKERRFGFRVRIVLKITQKRSAVLSELCEQYGIGAVRKNRQAYDWIIKDQKQILFLLGQVTPYVRAKRRQAEIAMQILGQEIGSRDVLLSVAFQTDALARFSVRSNNRRKNYAAMIQDFISPND